MEDNERQKDIIIPLIYTLFCLCVSIGGVLLVLYVFFPALSQPWQPIAALVLIGSTWIFWLLTYIYACIKRCCCLHGGGDGDRQIRTRRQTTRNASTAVAATQKDGGVQQGGKQESVASSNDSEIPLAYSA